MHMNYIDGGNNKTDYLVAGSKEGPYAASFKRYRVKPMTRPEQPRTILSIGWLKECYEAKEVRGCWLLAVAASLALTSHKLWHRGDTRPQCRGKSAAAVGTLRPWLPSACQPMLHKVMQKHQKEGVRESRKLLGCLSSAVSQCRGCMRREAAGESGT